MNVKEYPSESNKKRIKSFYKIKHIIHLLKQLPVGCPIKELIRKSEVKDICLLMVKMAFHSCE